MKGDYFIGTPSRLICYNHQKIVYHYWFIFQEKICLYPKMGDIIFKLQTGRIYNRNKSSGTYFVSDKIEITSIENANHIKQIARKRMKEHSQKYIFRNKKAIYKNNIVYSVFLERFYRVIDPRPKTKKLQSFSSRLEFYIKKAATYSPTCVVPSALKGLTALFGMVRGETFRYNHLKFLINRFQKTNK